jgi:hypothetical protein
MDLGMTPIPKFPWDPRTASDILELVGGILEHLKESYNSSHGTWD